MGKKCKDSKKCKDIKNKVAFIQSETVFEIEKDEDGFSTFYEYLKLKKCQFLQSKDENEIFKFIMNHAEHNDIFKFVCHIDSAVLEKLMEKMVKEKKSRFVKSLLKKCTFVATYSNADRTRDKNKATGSMFYFTLSPLSSVLKNCPGPIKKDSKEVLLCISESVSTSPYYQQIDAFYNDSPDTNIQKVTTNKLTKKLLDEFTGFTVVASLDTEAEYQTFMDLMNDSTYRKQVLYIENTIPYLTPGLSDKFANVQTVSSGVCITGVGYDRLNSYLQYEICAAIMTQCWRSWERFKKAKVLSLDL